MYANPAGADPACGGRSAITALGSRGSQAHVTSRTVRESPAAPRWKLARARKFALINPVMTSTGRCGRQYPNACQSARAICVSCVTLSSTLARSSHHEIGQLVDQNRECTGSARSLHPTPPQGVRGVARAFGELFVVAGRCCARTIDASSFRRRSISSTALRSASSWLFRFLPGSPA